MADELRDSPFLGERTITFVASITTAISFNGIASSSLSPVTDFEKKLLANQDKVREINSELNNGLVTLLKDAKDYIPPHTAMRVLLYGYSKNFLDKAYEIIYFAGRDRIVLTDKEINTIVADIKKDPNSQVYWLITIYAGDKIETLTSEATKMKLPTNFS